MVMLRTGWANGSGLNGGDDPGVNSRKVDIMHVSKIILSVSLLFLISCEPYNKQPDKDIIVEGYVATDNEFRFPIMFRATKREGGKPVANAVIQCYVDEAHHIEIHHLQTSTDKDGNFKMVFKPENVAKLTSRRAYLTIKYNNKLIYCYDIFVGPISPELEHKVMLPPSSLTEPL